MALHYLTVQDVLWINLQVTKKVNHFNHVKLEEATFYQYALGASKDLNAQAARFLPGFLKLKPFEAGNEATALIACAAFLEINGKHLDLDEATAANWLKQGPTSEALKAKITDAHDGHHEEVPDIRGTILDLVNRYQGALQSLAA